MRFGEMQFEFLGASISDKHARRRRPIGIAVCFSFVSSISYFRRFYRVKNQSPSRSTADGSSHPPRRPARRRGIPQPPRGRLQRRSRHAIFLTTARRDIWASPYVRRGSALVGERHHAQAKYRGGPQANMDAHNPASPAAGGASFGASLEMPRPTPNEATSSSSFASIFSVSGRGLISGRQL